MTAFFAITAMILWPHDAAATETGSLFRQESKVVGAADLLVADSGIRLEMPKTQITLISRAPDWKLLLLSDSQHKYFVSAPGRFRAPSTMTITLCRTSDTSVLKPSRVEQATLLGVKVNKIEMLGERPLTAGDRNWRKMLLHSATVWTQTVSALPPHVVRAIEEVYALPANKGVPLQAVTQNNKGRVERELTLLKVVSRPVTSADFTVPTKYLKVAKQEDLIEKRSDEIMDLIP